MRTHLITRLGALPWVRRAVFIGVGLAVFVLGATYLSLRYPDDVETFMVIGSGHVAAGEPTALRVRARLIDGRVNVPVTIDEVAFGEGVASEGGGVGEAVAFEAEGDEPVTVRFGVPAIAGRLGTVRLTARAGDRRAVLDVPVTVLSPAQMAREAPPRVAPDLPETPRPFRLSVLPQGAGVIARLDNRVFVRVRDPDGASVPGARVTITSSAFDDGELTVRTDAHGLAEFQLEATRPTYQLAFAVSAGGEEATFEETVAPAGRQLLLRGPSRVVAPGERATVEIVTWKRQSQVFCDLRRGPVWLWSRAIDLPTEDDEVVVGPLAAGRYDLQCYFNPHTPGSTWATFPLIVSDAPELETLTSMVAREARLHPASLRFEATGVAAERERAVSYLLAHLNASPQLPEVIVNTRADDDAAREEAWGSRKRLVLLALGGVFLLIVLVVFDLILGNILAQRDRMRAYAADLDEDEAPDDAGLDDLVMAAHKSREGLTKTRGVVLAVLVGGTIIANLVAFITLMILIR